MNIIWVRDFHTLYFWHWTIFWSVTWATILLNNWWQNNISLKKVLEIVWISRPDLPSSKLDYKNPEHIIILLSSIIDRDWNKLELDLKTIWCDSFSHIYFWYWTIFWSVVWATILKNNWWWSNISLKRILESVWILRPDLPSEELNFKDIEHIKILLSSITDKDWNKLELDLKTIWCDSFSHIYFWYWTEFWILSWQSLLKNNWWWSNISLKKILESVWISRPDL